MADNKKDVTGTATDEVAVHASASPPYQVKGEVVEAAPKTQVATEQKPYDPAAWMHQRLVHQVMEFEKNLGPEHEVGGRFVEGPSGEPLHLSNIASWGPDMILFLGEFPDGRKWELIQHYSQVSLLLVAVRKINEEPRRIGFELLKSVKEQDTPWEDPIS
ncbi:MAG: hypothetical protein EON61_23800 [Alphaproteobacteria bacterium]|nr:MAG: hypothetical protein EON61_23800 [Alphaproteobacteria bacterium]